MSKALVTLDLSQSESLLLLEALQRLREQKKDCLADLHKADIRRGAIKMFDERDFGIPDIDRLIKKIEPGT